MGITLSLQKSVVCHIRYAYNLVKRQVFQLICSIFLLAEQSLLFLYLNKSKWNLFYGIKIAAPY